MTDTLDFTKPSLTPTPRFSRLEKAGLITALVFSAAVGAACTEYAGMSRDLDCMQRAAATAGYCVRGTVVQPAVQPARASAPAPAAQISAFVAPMPLGTPQSMPVPMNLLKRK